MSTAHPNTGGHRDLDYFCTARTMMDVIFNTLIATLIPLFVGWLITRTERFKAWWAVRKADALERKEMPSVISRIASSLEALTLSDERRTGQFTAINIKLDEHTATLKAQNVALGDIASMSYGQMEQDPMPRFVCDNDGCCRLVNTAYARMMQCGRDELMQFGYRRFIPEKLNPGYMSAFEECAKQHRTFEEEVVFCRPDGSMFMARVRCVPHPEDAPPATHWNGVVRFLREYTTP